MVIAILEAKLMADPPHSVAQVGGVHCKNTCVPGTQIVAIPQCDEQGFNVPCIAARVAF